MQTFKVTNYKGLRGTVEVSIDGGSVIVQGKNAAGKSSFIDAIVELFDARGIRLTPHPIHDGAEDAEAEFIDTELDVKIRREWKRDKDGKPKSTLTIHALDGAKHAKPAEIIAALTGGLIFDPSRFLLMDPKPQREALLRQVELPFDLDELEGRERAAEDDRLKKGQAARAAEGAVTNADRPAPGTPSEPVSTSALVAKLDEARAHNARINEAIRDEQQHSAAQDRITDQIKELEAQIERLRQQYAEASAARTEAKKIAEGALIDTTELEAQVQNVDEVNRNVQLGQIFRDLEREAEFKRGEWEQADALVKHIQQQKAEGLKQAVFPHPDLSVSDEGVLFKGVPFAQANSAARNEAAFAIATSGNPDLKLVILKEGDLLDEDSLAALDHMAVDRGYTVLVERGRPDTGGLKATFVEMVNGQAVDVA